MPKRPAESHPLKLEVDNTCDWDERVLCACILRSLFIEAAREARDNSYGDASPVARQMLRRAARIDVFCSGSPVTGDRVFIPPPQISPVPSPEPSPILTDDPAYTFQFDGAVATATLFQCTGCAGCSDPPYGCWALLAPKEQRRRRIEYEHD